MTPRLLSLTEVEAISCGLVAEETWVTLAMSGPEEVWAKGSSSSCFMPCIGNGAKTGDPLNAQRQALLADPHAFLSAFPVRWFLAEASLPHSRPRPPLHPRLRRQLARRRREDHQTTAQQSQPQRTRRASRRIDWARMSRTHHSRGEQHLRLVVREFAEHYNQERHHQGLGNQLINPELLPENDNGSIHCRQRLGGLLNSSHRGAA